jgi:hypothetical protein
MRRSWQVFFLLSASFLFFSIDFVEERGEAGKNFSKVLYSMSLHSVYIGALTFENLCKASAGGCGATFPRGRERDYPRRRGG